MSGKTTFAITTPLYYVNAAPHLGSAYTTMAADVIARFHRLWGEDVLLITGTDEHGQKIQRTAEDRGIQPQTHCDEIASAFDRLWSLLNIEYDRFSRTTHPRHQAIVNEFFQRVWEKGDIYLAQQQGWYCVACEEFKDERDLLEGGICPIHTNQKTEWRDEQNYFFRLSHYQKALEDLYQQNPEFIQPESRRNEVLNFVKEGLRDFSISRVNLAWGFPLPVNPQHTLYVWFDALLGYVTALLDPEVEPTLTNALKTWWPIQVHLIGKDILRFHAVYWPAMQISAGIPVSRQVFGHGFLTKDGQKMGKSLGNTLDPYDLVERYGSDAVRYYFLKEIELGRDGDFSESRFRDVINADLANDLGNLLNRTLTMLRKYRDYSIPAITLSQDNTLYPLALTLPERVATAVKKFQISQSCTMVLELVQASNKYLDAQAPWTLYKQGNQEKVEEILYVVLESVRIAAVLLSPIIPGLSLRILGQLGYSYSTTHDLTWELTQWGGLPEGQIPQSPEPVFLRLS